MDGRLRQFSRLLAGSVLLAWICGRPWMAAAVTILYLLPGWLVSIWQAWQFDADITVALDPLNPNPELLLEGVHRASARCTGTKAGRGSLCIAPLYRHDGRATPLSIGLTPQRKIYCRAGNQQIEKADLRPWLPRHPLPLVISKRVLRLNFILERDRRLATTVGEALPKNWALAVYGALILLLLPFSGAAVLATALAGVLVFWQGWLH